MGFAIGSVEREQAGLWGCRSAVGVVEAFSGGSVRFLAALGQTRLVNTAAPGRCGAGLGKGCLARTCERLNLVRLRAVELLLGDAALRGPPVRAAFGE